MVVTWLGEATTKNKTVRNDTEADAALGRGAISEMKRHNKDLPVPGVKTGCIAESINVVDNEGGQLGLPGRGPFLKILFQVKESQPGILLAEVEVPQSI